MKEILVIFFYYVILAKFIKAELYSFYLFTYVYLLVSSLGQSPKHMFVLFALSFE